MTLVKCNGDLISEADRRWAREVIRHSHAMACSCRGHEIPKAARCSACKMYDAAMSIIDSGKKLYETTKEGRKEICTITDEQAEKEMIAHSERFDGGE